MGVVRCPACGGTVSEMAAACPHCGQPMAKRCPTKMKKKFSMVLAGFFISMIFLICMGSCVFAATQNTTKTEISNITEKAEGKVYVAWKKQNVNGYQLRWSLNSSMSGSKTASFTKTNMTRSGLIGGKRYYFQVRTYKIINGKRVYSGWSTKKSIKLTKLPPKTSITKISSGSNSSFTVEWSKKNKVKGYQIRYSKDSSFKTNTKYSAYTTKNYFTKKGLNSGTYYVCVRTYNVAASGTKYYSKWSAAKAITLKRTLSATPTTLSIADTGRVTVTFSGKGDVHYDVENSSIASCEWDKNWNGNSIGLNITALRPGRTIITITNSTNDEKVEINLTSTKYIQKEYGTVSGNVTYHYNKYKGYVPDTGSTVYLIPSDGSGKYFKESIFAYSLARDYNIYNTKVDGMGNYIFDRVETGTYAAIIISSNTTSSIGFKYDTYEKYKKVIQNEFSDILSTTTADSLASMIGYQNFTYKVVTVYPNYNTTQSHAFPYTYI